MTEDKDLILRALDAINPVDLDYQEWVNVGMALKAEGFDCSVWDDWSKNDQRYKRGVCESKWNGFNGSGLTAGTIVKMAKDRGFNIHQDKYLDWDAIIDTDEKIECCWDRKADLVLFLKTLFKPDENVVFHTSSVYKKDDKWFPGTGTFKNVGYLLERLETKDLEDVVYDSEPECGAWITINPIGGDGRRINSNVTAYRYALVESDTMNLSEQEKFLRSSNLPIATMVYSGGKSIHALVRVDAKDQKQYKERVSILYEYLKSNGIEIDEQNKNEARLTRMPGVYRNGKEQHLMAVNIGSRSWAAWQASLIVNSLPELVCSTDFIGKEIKLSPELIHGILRQGHKGVISGESKSGKSWALIQLAGAVASGGKWFGEYQCEKGGVLYINLEIDDNSFMGRINSVYRELCIKEKGNLYLLNMRGRAMALADLVPGIIQVAKSIENLKLIIIDPAYKVNTGDENNAGEMAKFCNQFDVLCEKTGAATFFCHHFAKGSQGSKKSIDRASGSGVLARDPDAILTLTKLSSVIDDDGVPLRLESTLREFKEPKPLNLFFRYPIHVKDVHDVLKDRPIEGSASANLEKSGKKTRTDEDKKTEFINAFQRCCGEDFKSADLAKMVEEMKLKERTIRDYAKLLPDEYVIKGGIVYSL